MGTRTDDLTDAAKPVADRLVRRVGHLKVLLSAGVIALDHLPPEDRERCVAWANGDQSEPLDFTAAGRPVITESEFAGRVRSLLVEWFQSDEGAAVLDEAVAGIAARTRVRTRSSRPRQARLPGG